MRTKLETEIKNLIFDQTNAEFATLTRKIITLESYIHCGITYGHRFTLIRYTGDGYYFRCTNCEFEYWNGENVLTKKEKKLVVAVFPPQKKKG